MPLAFLERFNMPLTNEEKLLGITEEEKKLKQELLTDKTQYIVNSKGLDNYSVVGGDTIKSIVSYEIQEKFMAGVQEIEYNGLIIKRKNNQKKNDFDAMSYNELKLYCQEKNIDIKGLKSKVDILNAIKGE